MLSMNAHVVNDYLQDVQKFFNDYLQFLQARRARLIALADDKKTPLSIKKGIPVNLGLTVNIIKNIEGALKKFQDYETRLPKPNVVYRAGHKIGQNVGSLAKTITSFSGTYLTKLNHWAKRKLKYRKEEAFWERWGNWLAAKKTQLTPSFNFSQKPSAPIAKVLQDPAAMAFEVMRNQQAAMALIVPKITEQLLRLVQVYNEEEVNIDWAASMMPTPFHRQQLTAMAELSKSLASILKSYPNFVDAEKMVSKKTWLPPALHFGSFLIAIRAAMQGLRAKSDINGVTLAADHEVTARLYLDAVHGEIKSVESASQPLAKETRKFFGCAKTETAPQKGSDYFKYFPEDVKKPVIQFSKLVEKKGIDELKAQEVIDSVQCESPKTKTRRTA